jgi:hypothetical protein
VRDRLIFDAETGRQRDRPVDGGANGIEPFFERRKTRKPLIEFSGFRLLRSGMGI